ncbi:MAG: YwbE family protein [Deltaproteobacteria bacterium]
MEKSTSPGNNRAEIKIGMQVKVVQKQDQRTGRLTEGVIQDILTNSSIHPHGIKVRLQSGIVGRVKEISRV